MNIIRLDDGSVIQFITYATSKETGKREVVYQEMKPPFAIYTMEEDHFERMIDLDDCFEQEPEELVEVPVPAEESVDEHSVMMQFLDAQTYKEKIRILEINREQISSDQLTLMAAGLDEYIEGTSQDELFYSFMQVLKTRARFESDR